MNTLITFKANNFSSVKLAYNGFQFVLVKEIYKNNKKSEIHILKKLQQLDGVNKLIEYRIQQNHISLVLEYCQFFDLDKVVKNTGNFSPTEVLSIITIIIHTLNQIHDMNILHRDVKASNILVKLPYSDLSKFRSLANKRSTSISPKSGTHNIAPILYNNYKNDSLLRDLNNIYFSDEMGENNVALEVKNLNYRAKSSKIIRARKLNRFNLNTSKNILKNRSVSFHNKSMSSNSQTKKMLNEKLVPTKSFDKCLNVVNHHLQPERYIKYEYLSMSPISVFKETNSVKKTVTKLANDKPDNYIHSKSFKLKHLLFDNYSDMKIISNKNSFSGTMVEDTEVTSDKINMTSYVNLDRQSIESYCYNEDKDKSENKLELLYNLFNKNDANIQVNNNTKKVNIGDKNNMTNINSYRFENDLDTKEKLTNNSQSNILFGCTDQSSTIIERIFKKKVSSRSKSLSINTQVYFKNRNNCYISYERENTILNKNCDNYLYQERSKDKLLRRLKDKVCSNISKIGICLSDFGVATTFKGSQYKATTLVGSLYWMSPEVLKEKIYSRSSDLWSLGVTAIELLQKYPPFFEYSPRIIKSQIIMNSNKYYNIASDIIDKTTAISSNDKQNILSCDSQLLKSLIYECFNPGKNKLHNLETNSSWIQINQFNRDRWQTYANVLYMQLVELFEESLIK